MNMIDPHAGFIRAICESPGDDLPRLVYADWLEEQAGEVECGRCKGCGWEHVNRGCNRCEGTGRVSNGLAERGEFIRLQVRLEELLSTQDQRETPCPENAEIYHLRKRERKLLGDWDKQWFGEWAVFGSSSANLDRDQSMFRVPIAKVDRGFVSTVSAPLAVLVGGECDRCGGHGEVESWVYHFEPEGRVVGVDDCDSCHGTGTLPGIAAKLIGVQPVTRWVATDKKLHKSVFENQPDSSKWMWVWNENDLANPSSVPWDVHRMLRVASHRDKGHDWSGYPTEAEALDALSAAVDAIAREQAGCAGPRGPAPTSQPTGVPAP